MIRRLIHVYFIALLSIVSAHNAHATNIIFDLGEVLVATNKAQAFNQNKMKFVLFALRNPLRLASLSTYIQHECLFRFLASVTPKKAGTPCARDKHNKELPQIMCDWMCAQESGYGRIALANIARAARTYQFKNAAERALVLGITTMMFTPARHIKTQELIPQAAAFARHCKKQGDKIYILSNWDKDSFALLVKKYPTFFALFDGIVTSADVGELKPSAKPFTHLLEKYNLDPAETAFIDDRPENIATADALGIKGILCTSQNIKAPAHTYATWRTTLMHQRGATAS